MSAAPPPQAAHRADAEAQAEELGPRRTTTGEMRAVLAPSLRSFGAKLTAAISGLSVAMALGTAWAVFHTLEARAQERVDAGLAPMAKRVEVLEQDQRHLREDVHEVQVDIRALYKAVTTGQRQERLEQPPPPKDGGQ